MKLLKRIFTDLEEYFSTLPKQNILRVVYVFYFLIFATAVYHVAYSRRIVPGVRIGSVDVGGLTYDQAKAKLDKHVAELDMVLRLEFDSKVYEVAGQEINLTYNNSASVSRAFEVGRTGNILVDSKDKFAGLIKDLYISAFYDYDEDLFHSKFSQLKGEINREARQAGVEFLDSGEFTVAESIEGRTVLDEELFKIIVNSFDRMNFSNKQIPVEKRAPTVVASEVKSMMPEIEKIIYNPLTIKKDEKSWTFTEQQMAELLTFEKYTGVNPVDTTIEIELNEPKLEGFLESIALEINQPPRGRVTEVDGEKVVKFEIIQNGAEIDKRAFLRDFRDAFLNAKPEVYLTLKEVDAPSDKDRYGIYALLGQGDSKYVGSSKARVHNLTLAAEKTSGVLVPPGGIYSLNNSVGEINGKNGFDSAYIIQNGRTVLGEGGGVCQTSTTLFRAVLDAGLPVVMRYPHAYRVSYYEQDRKVGFDAAIFQPSLDFQFRNDTPNYVLVQASADIENSSLTFKIYGTPDGRSVDITEPVVTSQFAPPEPLRIEDSTIAKGRVVQVEYPAWGAKVSFTRTVTRAGETLFKDTFNSTYQAWRAVYLVGTKD